MTAVWEKGFANKFATTDKLGEGAFGVVKVCHPKDKPEEKRAVKILLKQRMSQTQLASAEKEVEILQQLVGAPHIVQLLGSFEDTKTYYLVMELLEGGELFDRVVASGSLSENLASSYIRTVLTALDACHEKGIIHRDLKPENLLLVSRHESDEQIKIADFGCAVSGGGGQVGVVGSPFYIAPEILRQEPHTSKVDIWSVGVIAYILLSGAPPFFGANDPAIFQKIKKNSYAFAPKKVWDGVSDEAKSFIRSLLADQPADRPSAKEALQHAWLKSAQSDVPLEESIKNLRQFNARRKLRAAARAAITVNRLRAAISLLRRSSNPPTNNNDNDNRNENEKKEDEKKNESKSPIKSSHSMRSDTIVPAPSLVTSAMAQYSTQGGLDFGQFVEVMKKIGFSEGLPWERIHEMLDVDGDGVIDRRELECGLALLGGAGEEALRFCFRLYDTDNDGYLSPTEITEVLQCLDIDGVSADQVEALFERMDTNSDGQISFEEFQEAVKTEPLLAEMWLFEPSRAARGEGEGEGEQGRAKRARIGELTTQDTIPYEN